MDHYQNRSGGLAPPFSLWVVESKKKMAAPSFAIFKGWDDVLSVSNRFYFRSVQPASGTIAAFKLPWGKRILWTGQPWAASLE